MKMSIQIGTRGTELHPNFPPPSFRGAPVAPGGTSSQARPHGVEMTSIRQSFMSGNNGGVGGGAGGVTQGQIVSKSSSVSSNFAGVVQQSSAVSSLAASTVSTAAQSGGGGGTTAASGGGATAQAAGQFDGRRMRMRGALRRTVDYNVSVVNYLQVTF